MFDVVELNWWAILVATLVPTGLGFAWYTALGDPWLRAVGKSRDELTPHAWLYGVAVAASFVMAVALAHVVDWAGAGSFVDAVRLGLLIWLGFVATTMLVNGIFAGRSFRLWAIDGGYHLASLLGMSVILTLWD